MTFVYFLSGETGIGKSTLMDTLFNTNFDSTPATHDLPEVKLKSHTYGEPDNDAQSLRSHPLGRNYCQLSWISIESSADDGSHFFVIGNLMPCHWLLRGWTVYTDIKGIKTCNCVNYQSKKSINLINNVFN